MRFLSHLIVGLGLLVVPVTAQDEKQTVNTELVTLSWDQNLRDLHYFTAEGAGSLSVYAAGIAPGTPYKGPRKLVFYRDAHSLQLPPEERPTPFASILLPKDESRILLIFLPQGEQGAYRVIPVPIDNRAMPGGSYTFFNFSKDRVAGVIGSSPKFTVDKGKFQTITERSKAGSDLTVTLASTIGGKADVFYRSVWGHQPWRRTLVFVAAEKEGRLVVRKFAESIPADPKI